MLTATDLCPVCQSKIKARYVLGYEGPHHELRDVYQVDFECGSKYQTYLGITPGWISTCPAAMEYAIKYLESLNG